jgi:hypothetical protein
LAEEDASGALLEIGAASVDTAEFRRSRSIALNPAPARGYFYIPIDSDRPTI